jgi:hypothetical protein
MSDPQAGLVDLTARPTTVAALRRLRRPAVVPPSSRVRPVETTSYRLRAHLVAFRLEADSDIDLVIADRITGGTMIVAFPAPACVSANAPARARTLMRAAQETLLLSCGLPSTRSFTPLSGTGTISGVGFFASRRGRRGVAPNGIELHPVLGFASGTCR